MSSLWLGRATNPYCQGVKMAAAWFTFTNNTTASTTDLSYDFRNSGNDFNQTNFGRLQFNTDDTSSTTFTASNTLDFTFHYTQSFNWNGLNDKSARIKHALMNIFEKVPKSIKKQMTREEKKLIKAKYKSEKLLKQWLSPDEYKSLRLDGEVELPSMEDDDTIFIVKKDPQQMVDVKKKGTYSHKLCVVAKDYDYPVGDQLLSKILLLKTDEKKFKELAIKH